ncbi:hypothetical protein GCM10008933_44780 [Paenibacillus motobuensis]|uniref:Uncharacterized protein n=1 Tax=Paenibacillus motobuensis TaxID=295324 RepID=A0ABP3ILH8_9BACL
MNDEAKTQETSCFISRLPLEDVIFLKITNDEGKLMMNRSDGNVYKLDEDALWVPKYN